VSGNFFEDPGPYVHYDKDINRKPWNPRQSKEEKPKASIGGKNPFID
jgi:hypothetical protein